MKRIYVSYTFITYNRTRSQRRRQIFPGVFSATVDVKYLCPSFPSTHTRVLFLRNQKTQLFSESDKKSERRKKQRTSFLDLPYVIRTMNEKEKGILRNLFPEFLERLEPRDVLPYSLAASHITKADYEVVNSKVYAFPLRGGGRGEGAAGGWETPLGLRP